MPGKLEYSNGVMKIYYQLIRESKEYVGSLLCYEKLYTPNTLLASNNNPSTNIGIAGNKTETSDLAKSSSNPFVNKYNEDLKAQFSVIKEEDEEGGVEVCTLKSIYGLDQKSVEEHRSETYDSKKSSKLSFKGLDKSSHNKPFNTNELTSPIYTSTTELENKPESIYGKKDEPKTQGSLFETNQPFATPFNTKGGSKMESKNLSQAKTDKVIFAKFP